MSTANFNGLLIISVILIGPSVLAGLEVDLRAMTPVSCALRPPAGYAGSPPDA
jgi:hypothetical protein